MHNTRLVTGAKRNFTALSTLRSNLTSTTTRNFATSQDEEQPTSSAKDASEKEAEQKTSDSIATKSSPRPKKPTIAEQDEQLRQKMSGHSGEGGEAGIEYENGKPVAMKRSVKNNMFRYI